MLFVNNNKAIIYLIIDILPRITVTEIYITYSKSRIVYYVIWLSLKSRYIFQTVTEFYNKVFNKSSIV